MNSNKPNPFTPLDCDLRDFPFMPMDVVRLRDSDLAAMESPEACWAAVLLWCASWHQVPAASLPNDDRVLANLSGFGRVVKEWLKVKDGALRGWIECSDGRLYHPVIAEKAITALHGKYKQLWRTELAAIKKHNQRHPQNKRDELTFDAFMSLRTTSRCPSDNLNNNKGQEHIVTDVSPSKHDPIERESERDIERDIDNITKDNVVSIDISNQSETLQTHTKNSLAEICISLKNAGLPPFNQSHPTFLALIEAGATSQEFYDVAIEVKSNQSTKFNFGYIMSVVKGRREDAANLQLHKGVMPAMNSREAGRNAAAKSVFTLEATAHLRKPTIPTPDEIEVTEHAQLN